MNKRPLLLINGRWVRLDELVSMNTRVAAESAAPATADLVYVRKGKPDGVFRTAGFVETYCRHSGRQLISIRNPELS